MRKYQHVFASVEKVLVKPLFFVDENNGHTVSPVCADFLQTNCGVWEKCSKFQLIFVTAEEVLSKPFLSSLKKRLPHRFTNQLYVCLF